jgi:DNA-binding CsgD family transcriptional regulator
MNGMQLTSREEEILSLVVDGLTNEQIARQLGISSRTVEAHLRMLFRKTGASHRRQLGEASAAPDGQDDVPAQEAPGRPSVSRLLGELAERDRQIEAYDRAVQKLVDRQSPLFSERVEIVVTVGGHAGEDMVEEWHWTTPRPYLVYRIIRPITPWSAPTVDLGDSLTCDVVGRDVGVGTQVIRDRDQRPQVLILFQPGLEQLTKWVLRYRTPGLWDPLRKSGQDELQWATGTLDGRGVTDIEDLAVHFVFPPDAADADLVERNGVGTVERPDGDPVDHRITFRDASMTGVRYEWLLRLPPRSAGARSD